MKNLLYISLSLLTIYGCNNAISTTSGESKKQKSAKEFAIQNLELSKSKMNQELTNSGLPTTDILNEIYLNNNGDLFWFNGDSINKNGLAIINVAKNHLAYGLPDLYNGKELLKLNDSLNKMEVNDPNKIEYGSRAEILITNAFVSLSAHLKYGYITPDTLQNFSWKLDSLKGNFNEKLTDAISNGTKSHLENLQPKHIEFRKLQNALANYVKEFVISKDTFYVYNYKKDSTRSAATAKVALVSHQYISDSLVKVDSLYIKALKEFQLRHGLDPDAKIGSYTRKALTMSNEQRYLHAAVNIEKWKWKNEAKFDSDKYIYVNIPEYKLKFIKENKVDKEHKVVVGTPWTKTPEFSSTLKYYKVYPYWHVPYSISSGEILPAVKKDSSYLKQRGYSVMTHDNQVVNQSNIDWSKVTAGNLRYKFRQNFGRSNSLGVVVFMFPNKHSVFIHDTPSKSFFNRDVRCFSHGCIRLHNPVEFAKYIAMQDSSLHTADSVQNYVDNRIRKKIQLNSYIPVHIEYHSAQANEKEQLIIYRDIYGKDEKYMDTFKEILFPKDHEI